MSRILTKCLVAGLILISAVSFIGCGSESGGYETASVAVFEPFDRTSSEACTVCHESGKLADVVTVHSEKDYGTQSVDGFYVATIDSVIIPNPGTTGGAPTVSFTIEDENGRGVTVLTGMRFAVAKLVPAANGDASYWQSYINRSATKAAGDPGTAADGTTAVQANYESSSAGTLTGDLYGTYTYVFKTDLSAITTGAGEVLDVPYEPTLTHRFAMQISGGGNPVANPIFDFQPSTGLRPADGIDSRRVATVASCNECHHKLAIHGGGRIEVEYCVTCHNPGSIDPNGNNTVDLKVMVHKIHRGENLPSVVAGGEYAIWGYRDTKHDYSDVVYPQDIRTCTKCHDAADSATSEGGNWLTKPTIEACGSCHDNTSFVSPEPAGMELHAAGARSDNSGCASCHSAASSPYYIATVHQIPARVAAQTFQFDVIDVTSTAPGERPIVTFSVTNPTSSASYDILSDPEFTAGSTSRLYVLIGWSTTDYKNTGSGVTPGLPVQINALEEATDNGDGTFSVTSPTAIPDDISGSGVVAIEGHPAAVGNTAGTYDLRVPVANAVQSFAITDILPANRRTVVDIANCNQCHGNLSLHGNNRTGTTQVCVICHNGNATDINRRPDDPTTTTDGKTEETIDFKHLIHAIHGAGMREEGIVIYGYGNSEHDFDHVEYPGIVNKCNACHVSSTFTVPLNSYVWTTTINTGDDLVVPEDDRWITPAASVCSSCHDGTDDKLHMMQNGAAFDVGGPVLAEDGNAGIIQPPGHSTAPSCTSTFACHG